MTDTAPDPRKRHRHTGVIGAALLLALTWAAPAAAGQADIARDIMQRATRASGGDTWRLASTIRLSGSAWLYRDGKVVRADRYDMYRVYPTRLDAAHTTTGRFRLDAVNDEGVIFSLRYDGQTFRNGSDPLPEAAANVLAASSFGFSVVRFALQDGFELQRLPDDSVDGQLCYILRVTDPSGGQTLLGIDTESFLIRMVGWDTPRGWHQRIYSKFYRLEGGFMQPGRVRLYYDGVREADIAWTSAKLNVAFDDALFGPDAEPGE